MRVRVGETFRTVFYTPFYVALHRGFFAREGLEVVGEVFGQGELAIAAMGKGEVEIGLGGIMRSLVCHDRGDSVVPIHFAKVNDRDGFFLLGHQAGFDWPDLIGKSLILFSEAPTPWYTLRAFLRERGLDPDGVKVLSGVPAPQAVELFRAGAADYLQAMGPAALGLAKEGRAVVLRSTGVELGPLPYSSYYTLPGYYESHPEQIERFVRAHLRAQQWIQSAAIGEIWECIRPSFSEGDPEVLQETIRRYREQGTWVPDPTVSREDFDRLAGMLQRGGLISRVAPYELICRSDISDRVGQGG